MQSTAYHFCPAAAWLKITFDGSLGGTARVGNRRKAFEGQWVVFDKAKYPYGEYRANWIFAADTTDKCSAFIAALRRQVAA